MIKYRSSKYHSTDPDKVLPEDLEDSDYDWDYAAEQEPEHWSDEE